LEVGQANSAEAFVQSQADNAALSQQLKMAVSNSVPLAEHEALRQQLQMAVAQANVAQEVEALKQQLEMVVPKSEYDSVMRELETLGAGSQGLQQELEQIKVAHDALQTENSQLAKAYDQQVSKAANSQAPGVVDPALLDELEGLRADHSRLQDENSQWAAVAQESQEKAQGLAAEAQGLAAKHEALKAISVPREEHEKLKMQLNQLMTKLVSPPESPNTKSSIPFQASVGALPSPSQQQAGLHLEETGSSLSASQGRTGAFQYQSAYTAAKGANIASPAAPARYATSATAQPGPTRGGVTTATAQPFPRVGGAPQFAAQPQAGPVRNGSTARPRETVGSLTLQASGMPPAPRRAVASVMPTPTRYSSNPNGQLYADQVRSAFSDRY